MSTSGANPGAVTDLAVTSKAGFAGTAPIPRRGAYALAGPAASRNLAAPAAAAVSATGATNVTPFGFTTAAQANALVTAVNALVGDVANVQAVLRQLVADAQAYGLVG